MVIKRIEYYIKFPSFEPILPVLDIVVRLKELNPDGVPKWSDPKHSEKAQRRTKLWQKSHPDKVREYRKAKDSRRHAREVNAVGSFTRTEWCNLKGAYNNRCAYCGKKCKRLTVDHIIALIKGGVNTIDNIVPACGSCNSSKCDRLWDVQPSLKFNKEKIKGQYNLIGTVGEVAF